MKRLRHLWLTLRLMFPPLAWLTLLICLCAASAWLWLEREQASLTTRQLAAERSQARMMEWHAVSNRTTPMDNREARLARVFAALEQHGLRYRQVSYRYNETGVLTLELALDASYPQVKTLLTQLSAEPGISMPRLTLKRDRQEQAQLTVTLQLTLMERP